MVQGIPFLCFPPVILVLISHVCLQFFSGLRFRAMELVVASKEVRPRPSQEEIEQATWWLFQAWLVTMVLAFILGAVCWHRCGPRLCQWRQDWGRQQRSLWELWQELGNRREVGGPRSGEEAVSTEPLARASEVSTHTEAVTAATTQRNRKNEQNRKSNLQASSSARQPRCLDLPEPWRRQIQASENQRGRTFRIEGEVHAESSGGNNAEAASPGWNRARRTAERREERSG